ncbi:unnamed protein product, partial [Ectocarpus fasciculatus]
DERGRLARATRQERNSRANWEGLLSRRWLVWHWWFRKRMRPPSPPNQRSRLLTHARNCLFCPRAGKSRASILPHRYAICIAFSLSCESEVFEEEDAA